MRIPYWRFLDQLHVQFVVWNGSNLFYCCYWVAMKHFLDRVGGDLLLHLSPIKGQLLFKDVKISKTVKASHPFSITTVVGRWRRYLFWEIEIIQDSLLQYLGPSFIWTIVILQEIGLQLLIFCPRSLLWYGRFIFSYHLDNILFCVCLSR